MIAVVRDKHVELSYARLTYHVLRALHAAARRRAFSLTRAHTRTHTHAHSVCGEARGVARSRTVETSFSNSFVTSIRGCYAPRIRSVESGNEAERIIRNLHDARDEAGMRDGSGRKKSVTALIVLGYVHMHVGLWANTRRGI